MATNNGYNRTNYGQRPQPQGRRPAPNGRNVRGRKRKNKYDNNGFLWFMIVVIGILVIVAFSLLLNVLNDSGSDVPADSTPMQSEQETPEQTNNTPDKQTEKQTEETTISQTEPPKEPEYIPEFKTDLSAYEMYMNPQGDQRDAYLTLVNVNNPLGADFVPPTLVAVKSTRKDNRQTQKLQEYAAKALEALMIEAEACGMVTKNTPSGYPLSVMSAYRDYEYQRHLFYDVYLVNEMKKGYSKAEAEKVVATYSNRPGTSEHQLGLSVDMHTLSSAGQAFKNEKEAKWLAENSYKFGFILRYPEHKMEETGGIIYEPWHFRYVGRYHAKKMYDMDMCLEEYVEYLKNNG